MRSRRKNANGEKCCVQRGLKISCTMGWVECVSRLVHHPSHYVRSCSSELKSLKFRPSTDVHDYQVKIRAAQRFLERGDQVRILMQFRKREALLLPDAETMCQVRFGASGGRLCAPEERCAGFRSDLHDARRELWMIWRIRARPWNLQSCPSGPYKPRSCPNDFQDGTFFHSLDSNEYLFFDVIHSTLWTALSRKQPT